MSIDPAVPAERTALAWRRTALGVAVGGVVAWRVTGPVLGVGAAVAALAGSALAMAAWWLTGRRNRLVDRPAGPLVAVSIAATLIGTLALVFVLAVAR